MPNVRKEFVHAFTFDSARRKVQNALSTRERRAWAKKLMEAQEEVEAAQEKLDKLVFDSYEAGMALASIENATGLGPQTVRNAYCDHAGRAGEDPEGRG